MKQMLLLSSSREASELLAHTDLSRQTTQPNTDQVGSLGVYCKRPAQSSQLAEAQQIDP